MEDRFPTDTILLGCLSLPPNSCVVDVVGMYQNEYIDDDITADDLRSGSDENCEIIFDETDMDEFERSEQAHYEQNVSRPNQRHEMPVRPQTAVPTKQHHFQPQQHSFEGQPQFYDENMHHQSWDQYELEQYPSNQYNHHSDHMGHQHQQHQHQQNQHQQHQQNFHSHGRHPAVPALPLGAVFAPQPPSQRPRTSSGHYSTQKQDNRNMMHPMQHQQYGQHHTVFTDDGRYTPDLSYSSQRSVSPGRGSLMYGQGGPGPLARAHELAQRLRLQSTYKPVPQLIPAPPPKQTNSQPTQPQHHRHSHITSTGTTPRGLYSRPLSATSARSRSPSISSTVSDQPAFSLYKRPTTPLIGVGRIGEGSARRELRRPSTGDSRHSPAHSPKRALNSTEYQQMMARLYPTPRPRSAAPSPTANQLSARSPFTTSRSSSAGRSRSVDRLRTPEPLAQPLTFSATYSDCLNCSFKPKEFPAPSYLEDRDDRPFIKRISQHIADYTRTRLAEPPLPPDCTFTPRVMTRSRSVSPSTHGMQHSASFIERLDHTLRERERIRALTTERYTPTFQPKLFLPPKQARQADLSEGWMLVVKQTPEMQARTTSPPPSLKKQPSLQPRPPSSRRTRPMTAANSTRPTKSVAPASTPRLVRQGSSVRAPPPDEYICIPAESEAELSRSKFMQRLEINAQHRAEKAAATAKAAEHIEWTFTPKIDKRALVEIKDDFETRLQRAAEQREEKLAALRKQLDDAIGMPKRGRRKREARK